MKTTLVYSFLFFTFLFSCENKKQTEKTISPSEEGLKIPVTTLLTSNNRQNLSPREINNLEKIHGFRGLKLNVKADLIEFDDFTNSQFYGRSTFGKWDFWESEHGFISYSIDISHDPIITLAESQITAIRVIIINGYVAEIKLSTDIYELGNNFDIKELNQAKYQKLIKSLTNTFGEPMRLEKETQMIYHSPGISEDPLTQVITKEISVWETKSISLELVNSLPDIQKDSDYIPNHMGSLSLIYTSNEFEKSLDESFSKLHKSIFDRAKKENTRNYLGDF